MSVPNWRAQPQRTEWSRPAEGQLSTKFQDVNPSPGSVLMRTSCPHVAT